MKTFVNLLITASLLVLNMSSASAGNEMSAKAKSVLNHWTPARMANAIPRDLVIDEHGQGYLRKPDGSLVPYGLAKNNQLSATRQTSFGQPSAGGGSSETIVPSISNMLPSQGDTIGASALFSATITDASGIKSVNFEITYPDGSTTQSFRPGYAGNDTWEISLSGFGTGNWSWEVVAKDGASKGGNTATSGSVDFVVSTEGGDTGGGDTGGGDTGGESHVIENSAWTEGGTVQTAAGRIYFEMPGNAKRKGPWSGYVCSGTVATEAATDRSVIITAAHCVYDDSNKAFARNILFIPNQAGTSSGKTDTNCSNDPIGCWAPDFGVVDINWTTRTFPNNIEWDYAYYVVSDTGAHSGAASSSDALDAAAGSLAINFSAPMVDDGDPSGSSVDFTHALGYSYSDDPNFMYCAQDMTTEGTVNWWLPSCGLSGGSSGGPWVQTMDITTGNGPLISVNSWGYTTAPGMAGPKLSGTSAACLYTEASGVSFASVGTTDGEAGLAINYCP